MSVMIGHASINEVGKITGGKTGDQTGREVCTREWYKKGWTVLLRPTSQSLAEKSAKCCEAVCANDNFGYNQNTRNTGITQAKSKGYDISKVSTACSLDCSSFMTLCALAGGITYKKLMKSGNAPTTSTMRSVFTATGKYKAITGSKYLTSSEYLKRGDILVCEGHHTVMVLGTGSNADVKESKAHDDTDFVRPTDKTGTKYYPKYSGSTVSIVDALNSIGVSATYAHRKKIAKANYIKAYIGSAKQNTKMLTLLKQGKLIKE